jgi:hypothetical protein
VSVIAKRHNPNVHDDQYVVQPPGCCNGYVITITFFLTVISSVSVLASCVRNRPVTFVVTPTEGVTPVPMVKLYAGSWVPSVTRAVLGVRKACWYCQAYRLMVRTPAARAASLDCSHMCHGTLMKRDGVTVMLMCGAQ